MGGSRFKSQRDNNLLNKKKRKKPLLYFMFQLSLIIQLLLNQGIHISHENKTMQKRMCILQNRTIIK